MLFFIIYEKRGFYYLYLFFKFKLTNCDWVLFLVKFDFIYATLSLFIMLIDNQPYIRINNRILAGLLTLKYCVSCCKKGNYNIYYNIRVYVLYCNYNIVVQMVIHH